MVLEMNFYSMDCKKNKQNKSVLEEIRPPCTLDLLILKQKVSYFGHIMGAEKESLEKSTMLGMVVEEEEEADLVICLIL